MKDYEENNIFQFATKELSQDALIAWLINWINYKENKELYNKAKTLLNYILKPRNINLEEYKVEIKQQYMFIDIFVLLKDKNNNEKLGIIIEDKKLTTLHDNQIENYKNKIIENYKNLTEKDIITVYYKPYEEIANISEDVVKIDRNYMLTNIFNDNINNQIYIDYKNYLKKIQETYNKMFEIPLCEWQNRKEIYPMIAKKFNKSCVEENDKMEIVRQRGSTYIDWYKKENIPTKYKEYFSMIYLNLNINYDKYEIRIRGIINNYSEKVWNDIEKEITQICELYNIKTEKFKHSKVKEGSNILLAKINLEEQYKYNDVTKEIRKIENIVDKIIE